MLARLSGPPSGYSRDRLNRTRHVRQHLPDLVLRRGVGQLGHDDQSNQDRQDQRGRVHWTVDPFRFHDDDEEFWVGDHSPSKEASSESFRRTRSRTGPNATVAAPGERAPQAAIAGKLRKRVRC